MNLFRTFIGGYVLRLLVRTAFFLYPSKGAQPQGASAQEGKMTGHRHTNRLIDSTSPYLLQHAHNPVDWYPWSKEALDRARTEDKPIFLSIGYSACHWCHVMERESFENEEIAAIMNEHFVCIKVDGEERPAVMEEKGSKVAVEEIREVPEPAMPEKAIPEEIEREAEPEKGPEPEPVEEVTEPVASEEKVKPLEKGFPEPEPGAVRPVRAGTKPKKEKRKREEGARVTGFVDLTKILKKE